MGRVFRGDIGVELRVDTGIDLSGATVTIIRVKKPNKQSVDWTPSVSGTVLVYTTVAGDLDQKGVYNIISYVEFGSTSKHSGEVAEWEIFEPFFG